MKNHFNILRSEGSHCSDEQIAPDGTLVVRPSASREIELSVSTIASRCSDYVDIGQLGIDIAQKLGCAMVAVPTIRSHSPAASGVNPCVVPESPWLGMSDSIGPS